MCYHVEACFTSLILIIASYKSIRSNHIFWIVTITVLHRLHLPKLQHSPILLLPSVEQDLVHLFQRPLSAVENEQDTK